MKRKSVVLVILLLLATLTTSITYSYWGPNSVLKPQLQNNNGSLTIGSFPYKNNETVIDFDINKKYEAGTIVRYNNQYYIVTEAVVGKLPIPNDNVLTPFQPLYDDLGMNFSRTNANGYHFMNGILYRYKKQANGQVSIQQEDLRFFSFKRNYKYYKNVDEGSLNMSSASDYIVYYNGALYITNSMYDDRIRPIPGLEPGWTILNSPFFDSYSLYRINETNPYVSVLIKNTSGNYEMYRLVSSSNLLNGSLVKPGTNDKVWKQITP